jgi:copper(I)-binding protein
MLKKEIHMKNLWLVIVTLAAIVLGACNLGSSPQITIEDPWARAVTGGHADTSAEGSQEMEMMSVNGAAYMVIKNGGRVEDRLLRAEGDIADAIELHRSQMVDGVMRMEPQEEIVIPANGKVDLKPGDYHVMLIGLKRDLNVGDKFSLKLVFESAGEVVIDVEVNEP